MKNEKLKRDTSKKVAICSEFIFITRLIEIGTYLGQRCHSSAV